MSRHGSAIYNSVRRFEALHVRQSFPVPFSFRRRMRVFAAQGTCETVQDASLKGVEHSEQRDEFTTRLSNILRDCFLPVGYPATVTSKYTDFIRYNMIQVTFISLSRVLSTQAMLLAVGLGQGSALPIAAVMNWILKDGLGHLGSIVVGSRINTKFDSDPKRYKFLSVSLGQAANLLGIMSLARPGMFLLLTSFSSALSRVGTLAITASRARIYANFSASGNLGDLMRCSQAQSTLATLGGTAVGVIISPIVGADVGRILAVFAPVSIMTHYYAYKAVGVIELRTLNRQRFELIVSGWLEQGAIPSVAFVAGQEKFLWRRNLFSVEINPEITRGRINEEFINHIATDGYFVGFSGPVASVFFRDDCGAETVIKGAFHAFILARYLKSGDEDPLRSARNKIESEWAEFDKKLTEAGWDTSVTFIDKIDLRVSLIK